MSTGSLVPDAGPIPEATARRNASPPASGVRLVAKSVKEAADPSDVLQAGGDWPQWGGTRLRNNVPQVSGLPSEWNVGRFHRRTGEWDSSESENVRWIAELGSQTYGNPVIAGGRVFVGTNNGAGYLKRYPAQVDLGCLLAFDEATGKLLWQHSSEKLITGRVHDWPLQGICCAPLVEGDRLWFVTSRGEVRCLDTEGFYDGEDDGVVQAEPARVADMVNSADAEAYEAALESLRDGEFTPAIRELLAKHGEPVEGDVKVETVTENKAWKATGNFGGVDRTLMIKQAGPNISFFKALGVDDKRDADTIWVYNMMGPEMQVSQHNMCSCSVTSLGDLLFVNTSNGLDASHINLPSPEAPSFFCMDKNTGEVLWTDASPGENILHGQWSSPAVGVLDGVPQAIFAGGDGWLYSFRADRGQDGNPNCSGSSTATPRRPSGFSGARERGIISSPRR